MLFTLQMFLGIGLGLKNGFIADWYFEIIRYILLVSLILPLSLRVNLDSGKIYYIKKMVNDKDLGKTIVRNPNVCEDLGRITHLLTDKTGTLTQNKMCFKKLKTRDKTFSRSKIIDIFLPKNSSELSKENQTLKQFVTAIVLCHNVIPVINNDGIEYKGSSVDEIELVKFAKEAGFVLVRRDNNSIVIEINGKPKTYKPIRTFPFTPERKRMGILLEDCETKEKIFLSKGAEEVMTKMLNLEDLPFFNEETKSLATEGLRTLVFGTKTLTEDEYDAYEKRCKKAEAVPGAKRCEELMLAAEEHLEKGLTVLGASGVEDKLQKDVKVTIEQLKQAGIRVWVLTGDKVETAVCVGKAAGLISAKKKVVLLRPEIGSLLRAIDDNESEKNVVVLLDGKALEYFLSNDKELFIKFLMSVEGVILCRSSPTQKADVVKLLRAYGGKVCAVGDGGNDVGMIKASDAGIGIEGKEGQSASLAADVATGRFCNILKLLLWHGRNSYLRSTSLGQLILHRGVIICVIQSIYCLRLGGTASNFFDAWQLNGYTTLFTSFAVLALVLDIDLTEKNILLFPQFYEYLQKGKNFSLRVFFEWLALSTYQGLCIICLAIIFFGDNPVVIRTCAFSALIFVELFNVACHIHTWRFLMFLSLLVSAIIYCIAVYIANVHQLLFMTSAFFLKTGLVLVIACVPVAVWKCVERSFHPPLHLKVEDYTL